ncbi:MAG: hypothetical protein LBU51_03180 [Bacteroidales bacterium]|jgi:hypothetical protein|nr:hypothetical protein [Bacteroidales bacterium]
MLTLKCSIKITGKDSKKKTISLDYCNNIEVKTSIKNLTDTATVKIPRKIKWREKPVFDFLNRDDQISIAIGYEEYGMETVFNGYITSVENGFPIVIKCENEMRILKSISTKEAKKYDKFDLKKFFKDNDVDIDVVMLGDVSFGAMNINKDVTIAQALDKIMQTYTYLKCYFSDGKFYAVMLTTPSAEKKAIVFSPDRNMISDNLTYTLAEDVKVFVKAVHINSDNSKIEVYSPKDAEKKKDGLSQQQFYFPECPDKDKNALQDFADKKLKEFKVDKMTGTFTSFGIPFLRKSDIVGLRDNLKKERDGRRFVVDGVDYNFTTSGYRQVITLGDEIKSDYL